jgi:hypothetical protein
MKPIATPSVGGMITSTIHVLILVPVFFAIMRERDLRRAGRSRRRGTRRDRGVTSMRLRARAHLPGGRVGLEFGSSFLGSAGLRAGSLSETPNSPSATHVHSRFSTLSRRLWGLFTLGCRLSLAGALSPATKIARPSETTEKNRLGGRRYPEKERPAFLRGRNWHPGFLARRPRAGMTKVTCAETSPESSAGGVASSPFSF